MSHIPDCVCTCFQRVAWSVAKSWNHYLFFFFSFFVWQYHMFIMIIFCGHGLFIMSSSQYSHVSIQKVNPDCVRDPLPNSQCEDCTIRHMKDPLPNLQCEDFATRQINCTILHAKEIGYSHIAIKHYSMHWCSLDAYPNIFLLHSCCVSAPTNQGHRVSFNYIMDMLFLHCLE